MRQVVLKGNGVNTVRPRERLTLVQSNLPTSGLLINRSSRGSRKKTECERHESNSQLHPGSCERTKGQLELMKVKTEVRCVSSSLDGAVLCISERRDGHAHPSGRVSDRRPTIRNSAPDPLPSYRVARNTSQRPRHSKDSPSIADTNVISEKNESNTH